MMDINLPFVEGLLTLTGRSNKGTPLIQRFWRLVDKGKDDECWEWLGTTSRRYGKIRVEGKTLWAHRLSYELNVGPIPEGFWLLHRCDNPPCVNPHHLRIGDRSDNVADAISKGRARITHHSGEHSYQAKLTWEDVQYIRASTESLREIALKYNISRSSAHSVRTYKTWKTPGYTRLEKVGGNDD